MYICLIAHIPHWNCSLEPITAAGASYACLPKGHGILTLLFGSAAGIRDRFGFFTGFIAIPILSVFICARFAYVRRHMWISLPVCIVVYYLAVIFTLGLGVELGIFSL